MQKIDRNQLANLKVAGGCCGGTKASTSTPADPVPR